MNVKGIMPIAGSNCATQKIANRRVLTEKPDSFETKKAEEKKCFKTKVKDFVSTFTTKK